jgi:GH24 family phage-related lysozyme (muramidase)
LTPGQLAILKLHLEADEGRTTWLYLDSRGNPTCGVGHLTRELADALALPFAPPVTEGEWVKLTNCPPDRSASVYAGFTDARLSDAGVDAILNADIDAGLKALAAEFKDFETWPGAAQLALADMSFNLGQAGLMKFTHLVASVRARNWKACAMQCHRRGISDQRNRETADLFTQANSGSPE